MAVLVIDSSGDGQVLFIDGSASASNRSEWTGTAYTMHCARYAHCIHVLSLCRYVFASIDNFSIEAM
jgi:hypothetical protein